MLGFLIGAACLIGLIKVVRGGRRWGYGPPWMAHHACGHAAYDDFGERGWGRRGHGGRHGGWGRSIFLRPIFERLDTSPGQEKAIRAALDELRETARGLREEARGARADVARVIRGETLDEMALGELSTKANAAATTMRDAVESALTKIHAALDDEQRGMLADWIERGARWRGWAG